MEGKAKTAEDKNHEGFRKVGSKGKVGKRSQKKMNEDRKARHNRFKILEEEEGNKEIVQDKEKVTDMEGITNQQKDEPPSYMEISRDQEMNPSEVGT